MSAAKRKDTWASTSTDHTDCLPPNIEDDTGWQEAGAWWQLISGKSSRPAPGTAWTNQPDRRSFAPAIPQPQHGHDWRAGRASHPKHCPSKPYEPLSWAELHDAPEWWCAKAAEQRSARSQQRNGDGFAPRAAQAGPTRSHEKAIPERLLKPHCATD